MVHTSTASLGAEPEHHPFRVEGKPLVNGDSRPATATFARPHIDLFNGTSPFKTVAEIIEFHAAENPDHAFCIQAERGENSETFDLLDVSYRDLKQAILRCSQWLMGNVAELSLPAATTQDSHKVLKGNPVALFMESDVGLLTHQLSLISLGVPVLLLSARLSPNAVNHLLQKTRCHSIIVSERLKKVAADSLSLFEDADAPTMYIRQNYRTFFDRTTSPGLEKLSICGPDHWIGEDDCNVLILHSSGTTGLPKPIYTSHKHLLCYMLCHDLQTDDEALGVNVTTLPLYHGFGLLAPMVSLGCGKTLCIPPPSIIPTGKSTLALLRASKATSLMSVPSILEDISLMPEDKGPADLARLHFVAFGGGLLKTAVGEKLTSAGVKVLNHYGTTETGGLSAVLVPPPDYDWRFFRLRTDLKYDIEPRPREHNDDGPQRYKMTANPFGWGSKFEIQDDLLLRDPKHPNDYTAAGRNDDMIVLATGEKVLPGILESKLCDHELVKAAIAFGEGQFEPGVLIQPVDTVKAEQYEGFKESLWPIIRAAGEKMDAHARISGKAAVVILPPGTNVPRSDKGSILRKEVYKVFADTITEAYRSLEDSAAEDHNNLDMNNLESGIKEIIQTRLDWRVPEDEWTVDDDLFELGMDSLQALRLRRSLLASLESVAGDRPKDERIDRHFVYQHPSVVLMANAIRADDRADGEALADGAAPPSKGGQMQQLVDSFAAQGGPADQLEIPAIVLMTGSTGSLGTYILAHLAQLPEVSRVFCLNRQQRNPQKSSNMRERQLQALRDKGIELTQDAWNKVSLMATDTTKPNLGLSQDQYDILTNQVTHILHSAWPMDFRMQLLSFRGQFQTLHNLLALARCAYATHRPNRIRFVFASSIAAVGQYPITHGRRTVPELPMDDERSTNAVGYGEAKMVCERIMERAALDYPNEIDPSYVRIGQMSGSARNGFWNADEHLAALLRSSQKLGQLPKLEGTLSWIPVDSAAAVMSEILLNSSGLSLVYHMENPIRQSWFDAMQCMASTLGMSASHLLPFDEWLAQVVAVPDNDEDHNPAKTLVDFFEKDFRRMSSGQVILSTDSARKVSPTLRDLDLVSEETISSYLGHWKKIGFLA